jgi:hypothetical protein
MANTKSTPEMGALTLVLLVQKYRSQMIALLVKNGIVVPNNASDQQIASLMASLLKVSKSYFKDLNDFLMNPKVVQVLAGGVQQTAQYLRMSGSGFMSAGGDEEDNIFDYYDTETDPVTGGTVTTPSSSTPPKKGFFSGVNFTDLFTQSLHAFQDYTKGQTDAEIAKQRALVEQAKADAIKAGNQTFIDPTTGQKVDVITKPKKGLGTTTIVLISLGGVALLGTIIFLLARKKQ